MVQNISKIAGPPKSLSELPSLSQQTSSALLFIRKWLRQTFGCKFFVSAAMAVRLRAEVCLSGQLTPLPLVTLLGPLGVPFRDLFSSKQAFNTSDMEKHMNQAASVIVLRDVRGCVARGAFFTPPNSTQLSRGSSGGASAHPKTSTAAWKK